MEEEVEGVLEKRSPKLCKLGAMIKVWEEWGEGELTRRGEIQVQQFSRRRRRLATTTKQ